MLGRVRKHILTYTCSKVPYNDLIPAGVADQNMVKVLRDKYDITRPAFIPPRRRVREPPTLRCSMCTRQITHGHDAAPDSSGFFDKNSFLEMMAPLGYRAHESMRFVVPKLR